MFWNQGKLVLFSLLSYNLINEALCDEKSESKLWVLLVAGSNGWYNYRHQADVCHSYQVVIEHGVDPENVIVMMNDDIAFNPENPYPGIIINQPDGPDVYHGVPKDYNHLDNNPKVFLDVLQGKDPKTGSRRVIKSGPNDRIFVYFTDHGAPGLLGFGDNVLKATALNKAIKDMHLKKKFKEMVFYIEACESGSIFDGLLDPHWNVYGVTASNSTSSSYACYHDDKLQTYLGDVYSVKWLQDSDHENLLTEKLKEQFSIVKKETTTSTVMEYGDLKISNLPVANFQGKRPYRGNGTHIKGNCGKPENSVPSEDVPLRILNNKKGNSRELELFHAKRKFLNSTVEAILSHLTQESIKSIKENYHQKGRINDYICYDQAVDVFHEHCFNVARNDYAMRFLFVFVHLCNNNYDITAIVTAIHNECNHNQNDFGRIF